MHRLIALVLLAGLFGGIGLAMAQEGPVTIKLKQPQKGDIVLIEKKDKNTVAVKAVKGDMVLQDRNDVTVSTMVYKEKILERTDKTVTKRQREYIKAEQSKNNRAEDLQLSGKTVIIEKQKDKYTFTFPGGKAVEGPVAALLEQEFANKSDRNMDQLMMPKKPVKAGDEWKVDMPPLMEEFNRGGQLEGNAAKATGTGKVLKLYKKDGRQYGELLIKISIPITAAGQGKGRLKLEQGSTVVMEGRMDICIDGSSTAGAMTLKTTFDASGPIPGVEGGKVTIKSTGSGTQTQSEPGGR